MYFHYELVSFGIRLYTLAYMPENELRSVLRTYFQPYIFERGKEYFETGKVESHIICDFQLQTWRDRCLSNSPRNFVGFVISILTSLLLLLTFYQKLLR